MSGSALRLGAKATRVSRSPSFFLAVALGVKGPRALSRQEEVSKNAMQPDDVSDLSHDYVSSPKTPIVIGHTSTHSVVFVCRAFSSMSASIFPGFSFKNVLK